MEGAARPSKAALAGWPDAPAGFRFAPRPQQGRKLRDPRFAGNKGKQRACGIYFLSPEPEVGGSNPPRRATFPFVFIAHACGKQPLVQLYLGPCGTVRPREPLPHGVGFLPERVCTHSTWW